MADYRLKDRADVFLMKAKAIHGEKYDYSLVDYRGSQKKVKIICNTCGLIFEQTPDGHKKGRGCRDCALARRKKALSSNTEEFISKAKAIHGNKYGYPLVNYKNSYTRVKITCNRCQRTFKQAPMNHLRGQGCPKCNTPKVNGLTAPEREIEAWFKKKKITARTQWGVSINGSTHVFDFWLPDLNTMVEYDGEFHIIPINGEEELIFRQNRDLEKNQWCQEQGIRLVRISYLESIKGKLRRSFK